ncbi:SepA family multidrug efflux transporter [Staphylococcus aureus]|uniref:SepA family multidrug efflux transporter n=1 Tax=Staphylococcus aureus TaxID=1280 RepID=UPI003CE6C4B6
MDYFRKMLPENAYFRGATFHLDFLPQLQTTLFYFIIHLNYVYINIDFLGHHGYYRVLYMFVSFNFYPESKNFK